MENRDLLKEHEEKIFINDIQIRTYLAVALKSVGLDPQDSLTDFMSASPYGHKSEEMEKIVSLADKLEAHIEPMFLFGYDNNAKLKSRMLSENLALKLNAVGVPFTDRELETIISTFLSYSSNFQIFNN